MQEQDISEILLKTKRAFSEYAKGLDIVFVPHHTGTRADQLKLYLQGMNNQTAAYSHLPESFKKLLLTSMEPGNSDQVSAFLGMVTHHTTSFGGLINHMNSVALISINLDAYHTLQECEYDIFKLCWNICPVIEGIKKSEEKKNHIFIPQRKLANQIFANLKGDIFSCLLSSLMNQTDNAKDFAVLKARDLLTKSSLIKPEHSPFLIAYDKTRYLLKQSLKDKIATRKVVDTAYQIAGTVTETVKKDDLLRWIHFASSAQSMVWRDLQPSAILSAAIDGNDNIEIRKLGIMVSELVDIAPVHLDDMLGIYNPFINDAENEKLHKAAIEECIESIITRCIFENSSEPLYKEANYQNQALKKGRFLGWCAPFLQAAGRAYDEAQTDGISQVQAARRAAVINYKKIDWKTLKGIGDKVFELRRIEENLSYTDIMNLCDGITAAGSMIRESLEFTQQQEQNLRNGLPLHGNAADKRMTEGYLNTIASSRASPAVTVHHA